MYYSYVMGISNKVEALENDGFIIEKFDNNYGVAFPKEKAHEWEEFIAQYLEVGYWNEYLLEKDVVFLFHLEDGIKRYE